MKNKLCGVGLAVALAFCFETAAPQPASAQNVDGFINLLGRVIEHDIQRQEIQRQRRYQENQRAAEQKRIRAQEQARKSAEREREIALTKRVQSALSKLGFYKSAIDGDRGPGTRTAEAAFSAAFGLPPLSLAEQDVATVEYYASTGFRSRAEMDRAEQGGFQSRQELADAEAGGFTNASEMAAARNAGFSIAASYRAFRNSTFENPEDFRAAEQGGFTDPGEFAAAKSAGFGNRAEYREFLDLGLPDKSAFEARKRSAALAEEAGLACAKLDDSPIVALDTCLSAISKGARGVNVATAFASIGDMLKARRDELAAGAPEVEVANTDGSGPTAGAFLQELALIDAAIQRHECGADMLRSAWAEAEASCLQTSDLAGGDVLAALKAEASENLEAERQKIAAEEEARRIAAEAERDRLALEAARDRVETLTDNLTTFLDAKRALSKPLDVAKAFVVLKQQRESTDFRPIEQALTRLEDLLSTEDDFQKFLEEKRLSEDVAKTNARATAEAEIRRTEAFIEQYVAANLLDDRVAELLALQAALSDARKSAQDVRIMNGQREAKATIERLGLSGELVSFVHADADKPSNIQTASNGLAITEENKPLLEGDPKDILLLGNFGPDAPHLVLNLLGKPAFDGGAADYCWQGGVSGVSNAEIRVNQALQSVGAEKVSAAANCSAKALHSVDVIVFERGLFLQSDVAQASVIVEAFERRDLKLLEQIAWADVGEEALRNTETADSIKKDVIAGLRSGYGFVQSDNGAPGACLVVEEKSLPLHRRLFDANKTALDKFMRSDQPTVATSLERAFVGVQKQNCGLVYAEAADLRQLLQGMDKARLAYSFLPVWIGPDAIAAERAALNDMQTAEQRDIAARQQEREGQQTLAAKQASDAETRRSKAQAELRSRYAQEAKAAYNRLSGMAEEYLRSQEDGGEFGDLFPEIALWKRKHLAGGWEISGYRGTLVDFGTADWQGRRLEAILVETVAESKNAALGVYAEHCFVTGYLRDDEFGQFRDVIAAPCTDATEPMNMWRAGRGFQSRWIVR